MRKKKSQSILEYLGVFVAVVGASFATFVATNQMHAQTHQGLKDTFTSTDTLIGQTIEDDVEFTHKKWPSDWRNHMDKFDGTIPEERIANPVPETGDTVGQPRSELTEIFEGWD